MSTRTIPERYRQSGQAMSGGMGDVIVCSDKILERQVAIKFVKSTKHKRRMDDEVNALLRLRSKHVVQIYDVVEADTNEIGIVQEYIDGLDLFESRTPPADAATYYKQLWQIASGIVDIHAVDVIHRDIKPNNMKTDPEGVIKIFDFGLAREDGPKAATAGFVGTQGFAAPELYEKPFRFTKAVDTYAFGATALFLAKGDLPSELLDQPPSSSPDGYFSALGIDISPEVAQLLDSCIRLEPERRPPMKKVRDALAKHILLDKHRALVVYQGRASFLGSENRSVGLSFGSIGSISIRYDGLDFVVESVSGEVQINNKRVATGKVLQNACVIALGDAHRHNSERRFVTFDISHPEIVL